jgi:hypothetical protein
MRKNLQRHRPPTEPTLSVLNGCRRRQTIASALPGELDWNA